MLQYIAIALIFLYLQTRFWWVRPGYVAVKRCRWKKRGSELVVLGPGRHYIIPLLESAVVEKGGKRCEWPAGSGCKRTIENARLRTQDNTEFMVSVTYRFNVDDVSHFSAWIQGDKTDDGLSGSLSLLDAAVIKAMGDVCKSFKALAHSPRALKQELLDKTSTQMGQNHWKMGIKVYQPSFSAFGVIVDLLVEHERVHQRSDIAEFLKRNWERPAQPLSN